MTKKRSQHNPKHSNQQKIIRLLCQKKTINQVDIAEEIKASLPTVINNVNELVKNGILERGGVGDSRGGRKPVVVNLNKKYKFIIGIDFLVDTIKVVIFNLSMEPVALEEMKSSRFIDFDTVMDKLTNLIKDMLLENNITVSNLLGIGISIPGVINTETKSIEVAPNLHIADTHVKKYSKLMGVPVFFENEANAAAYAEWQTGAAQGARNVLYLSIMKGVGAGIIIGNKPYRGSRFKAGEVGHIIIKPGGRKCTCGEQGCLNEYISAESLIREYSNRAGKTVESLTEFMTLTENNEKKALEIWDEYVADFAFGIRTIISTLDPETIVIGGEIARYSNRLIPAVHEQMKNSKSNVIGNDHQILSSELMESASITGVALYLRNKFISKY
ncbi:MAG: ROK family transcriptional regulator [Spirochaetales bacterium]|nr:ROK family transcriptional regulator [Spirochaetales bacterium]MCF7938950.1 ROK family transcriptional regulator [Spirochaetales bacterium]